MKRFWLIVPLLLAVFGYRNRHHAFAGGLGLPHPRCRVRVERALMIPMRDGIRLSADHFHPVTNQKSPTILIRTPYGRNLQAGVFGWLTEFCARRFAEQGYEVIVQDTRGRFDSEGEFEPFFHEREDAQATFDWLAGQPWFDGQVGMWGSSYLGIVQWAVADHPLVKALVPTITTSHLYEIVFPDGALDLGLIMRWISLLRIQENRGNSLRQIGILLDVERDVRPTFKHLPVSEADQAMHTGSIDYYGRWMDGALNDPSFAAQIQSADHQQVQAPVHLIGGWYDFFLRGQLDDYAALKAAGHTPYLTIGPWMHFSHIFLMPATLKPGLEWFNAHMKNEPGHLRSAPVRLYVMGANQWRDYADFPPPSQPLYYYLGDEQTLETEPHNSKPSRYCYDPAHPAPIVGGSQFHLRAGARDNRKLARRADVLSFTGNTVEQPIEIIGNVSVDLYVQSSSEFTDFYARLCDVFPNGRSMNICDGFLRLEPGKGERQPDGSFLIQIKLWATAYRFLPGHCIRLLVSSSAHPRWARHTNTPHPFTDTAFRAVEQTIYHDPDHPSVLALPNVEIK